MAFDAGTVIATLRGDFSATAFHDFSSAMYKARSEMQATERRAAEMSARSKQSLDRMAHAAKVVGLATGAGLVAGIGYAIKKAADFEQQLSSLKSVTGATGAQMGMLRKQAMDAGAATKFSALDAAQAQTELAKGGLTAAQILGGALNAALGLAAAGELDLADAAKFTVNSMQLFGLEAGKAGHVADAFATAANTTTADVQDFGMALTQGGAAAKAAGYDFDQTVTVLEALAQAGVKNSDAGTSMKAAFLQLLTPTKQQTQAAKDAGLAFVDQAGHLKSAAQISSMLRRETDGMTKAQRASLFATLAGQDGIRTLLALYDAGPDALRGMEKGLAATGTAAKVAAEKQDNLKGRLENLKGSVETAAISVGTKLLPGLTRLAEQATTAINALVTSGKTDQWAAGIIHGAQTAGQVIGDVVPIAVSAAGALAHMAQALQLGDATHLEAILAAVIAFKAVSTITPMVLAFSAAVKTLALNAATAPTLAAFFAEMGPAAPITLAATAVAGLAAGLILLGGRESDESQRARENAQAHRDQAEAIKSVGDAERASADKGLAAKQATLDLKDATANLNDLRKRGVTSGREYERALLAQQQASLRSAAAHRAYNSALDKQRGAQRASESQAVRNIRRSIEHNAALLVEKQRLEAVTQGAARGRAALQQRESAQRRLTQVSKALSTSQSELAKFTRDYLRVQAQGATTDLNRQRLMNASTQITGKNAAAVANLIGYLNLMPQAKRTRFVLEDQAALAKLGSYVGKLNGQVPHSKITQVLAQSGSAESALRRLKALLDGLHDKQINVTANAVTNRVTNLITHTAAEATGGPGRAQAARAMGRGPIGAERALIGEDGPEWRIDPASGLVHRVERPMIADLAPSEYIIPASRKQPQRFTLMRMLARDLGVPGYDKGRTPKASYLKLAPEQYDQIVQHDEQIASEKGKDGKATKRAVKAKARLKAEKAVARKAHEHADRAAKWTDEADIARSEMDLAEKRGDEKAYKTWRSRRLADLRKARKVVEEARKYAKPGSRWERDTRRLLAQLANDLQDTVDARIQQPAAQALTAAQQDRLDRLNADVVLASLTTGSADDITAEQAIVDYLTPILNAAKTPAAIIELGGQIQQAQGQIDSLRGDTDGSVSQDQQAITDQAYQQGVAQAQSDRIDRIVTALVSGQQVQPVVQFNSVVPAGPRQAREAADVVVTGITYQGGRRATRTRVG